MRLRTALRQLAQYTGYDIHKYDPERDHKYDPERD